MKKRYFIIFACVFSLFSCASTKLTSEENFQASPKIYKNQSLPQQSLYPKEVKWEEIQEGFYKTSFHIEKIKVHWTCVKIHLDTPNLNLVCQPTPDSLGKTFKLKKFAQINKTVLAINTTPFDLKGKSFLPVGITKINDNIISPANKSYCALCFYYDNQNRLRAEILPSQDEEALKKYKHAFGGFFSILIDNEIQSFEKSRRSRVACGINQDSNILYILVTTPDFHIKDRNGLNYEECAAILKELGSTNAMQFDGGHSSGLCIYDKNVESPFLQRKVPTALGFNIKGQ